MLSCSVRGLILYHHVVKRVDYLAGSLAIVRRKTVQMALRTASGQTTPELHVVIRLPATTVAAPGTSLIFCILRRGKCCCASVTDYGTL
jgi:hypothetical protein